MRFADYLKSQRRERGWTQAEMSAEVERLTGVAIPARNIKKWEQGRGEPSLPYVEVLSRVFGYDLPWVTNNRQLRQPPPRGRKAQRI